MDFDSLYTIGDGLLRGAFRVTPGPGIDDMALERAENLSTTALAYRHFMGGGKPKDLIGTSYASPVLLCDRIIQILRERRFSGWTTYPIELYGKKGERIQGYQGFAVTGRCGPVLWKKGKKIRKPAPFPQGQACDAWLGLYFDPDNWDGSDIFMPEGTTYKIITEPVMKALTSAKVKNIKFERLTEFERSWDL